jgi:hypothetical protein
MKNIFKLISPSMLAINTAVSIGVFMLVRIYIIAPLAYVYRYVPYFNFGAHTLTITILGITASYFSLKSSLESGSDMEGDVEQVITGDLDIERVSPEAAERAVIALLTVMQEKIKNKDWNEAWAYCGRSEDMLNSMTKSQRNAYLPKIMTLKGMIEKGLIEQTA